MRALASPFRIASSVAVRVAPVVAALVALFVAVVIGMAACSSPPREAAPPAPASASSRYVDLTHDLGSDAIFWPTSDTFQLIKVADGVTDKGYYYASNNFSGSEHGGTHLDAPVHFAQGHWTVDQIPLDRLVGNAVVVDVSQACVSNADYQVSTDDFTAWEQAHGVIEADSIVL